MSTTTMTITPTRFVRQVSNGCAMSKYSYLAMQQANEESLKSAKWREAKCQLAEVSNTVNQLVRTDGEWDDDESKWITAPSWTAWMDDRYDCYKQAGDLVKSMASMCGYAGCVAYRFKLPDEYGVIETANVSRIALPISRDRYCKDGVRVAVALSDSSTPSDDWTVIRGTASGAFVTDYTSGGYLAQSATNLLAGRAETGTLVFDATSYPSYSETTSYAVGAHVLVGCRAYECVTAITYAGTAHPFNRAEWMPLDDNLHYGGLATSTRYDYLWVYLTLENYNDHWAWYSDSEARNYYIEGSAMLVAAASSITFADEINADTEAGVRIDGMNLSDDPPSPTWAAPLANLIKANDNSTKYLGVKRFPMKIPFYNEKEFVLRRLPSTSSGDSRYWDAVITFVGMVPVAVTIREYLSEGASAPVGIYLLSFINNNGNDHYAGCDYVFTLMDDGESISSGNYRFHFTSSGNWVAGEFVPTSFKCQAKVDTETAGVSQSIDWYEDILYKEVCDLTAAAEYYADVTFASYNGGDDPTWNDSAATSVDFVADDGTIAATYPTDPMSIQKAVFISGHQMAVQKVSASINGARAELAIVLAEKYDASSAAQNGYTKMMPLATAARDLTQNRATAKNYGPLVVLPEYGEFAYVNYSNQMFPSYFFHANNEAVAKFGKAECMGDTASFVATKIANYIDGSSTRTIPNVGEVFRRLVRMSRQSGGGMGYCHPHLCVLPSELDQMHALPRFKFGTRDATYGGMSQNGLYVKFVYNAQSSDAEYATDSTSSFGEGKVRTNEGASYLVTSFYAIRSTASGKKKLTVAAPTSGPGFANTLAVKLAVWKSSGGDWDGCTTFGAFAFNAVPPIFQTDGASDISWTSTNSGSLVGDTTKSYKMRRVGVSSTIAAGSWSSGANNFTVDIPLLEGISEGDVVIIAPVVQLETIPTQNNAYAFTFGYTPWALFPAHWARCQECLGLRPTVTLF